MRTEAEVSEDLCKFFKSQGWDYREKFPTKSGKEIDFVVKAPYDGGSIFFGVECKRDIGEYSKATALADYLEQARAYSTDLDMPVFLAPVISSRGPSELYHGGTKLDALSALTIFGGRVNVGLLVQQDRTRYGTQSRNWLMVLRGGRFWDQRGGFNPKKLSIVCSTGSAKERKDIKIWK
jgi:hypothetical protein